MARALFLRHHLEDSPGLVGEALVARGYELDVAMMNEHSASPSLEGYDLMVILGSNYAVYDEEVEAAWFGRELTLIADADQRGLPILGICFGAQALCRHFGGTVQRANESEVGWYEIDVESGVTLSTGPWFQFHFDACSLPDVAQLWATTPRAVQVFAIGPHVGVQFHPEIDDVQLQGWLDSDEESARALNMDLDALVQRTARETPAARARTQSLVDLFLGHVSSLTS